MIEVKNLSKSYGSKKAIKNISFKIESGEIVGFLGPNGAGKSTTMNILCGYISSDEGKASICGYDILDDAFEAKKHVGYLPEQPPLYQEMTVEGYLDFVYNLKKTKIEKAPHIQQICKVVKIEGVYKRLIKNLSKGYKQRVGIAAALIGNPDVLVLDEPTVGLDPQQIIEIRTLIKKLSAKHTVLISSHILSEVSAVCDRVIVISEGEIVADDKLSNLSKDLDKDNQIQVRVLGNEKTVYDILSSINGVEKVTGLGEKETGAYEFIIRTEDKKDIRQEMFNRLAERNFPILMLKSSEMSLEDVFLNLTKKKEVK